MKFGKLTDIDTEAEANYFAMCLLIPEDMLRSDIDKSGIIAFDVVEDEYIEKLAKRYQVTTQLMIVRLVDLGYMKVC